MELIYAALLLHTADQDVTEENVQGVLDGAGVEVDDAAVKALVAALEDVDIEDAMETAVATGAPAAAPAADAADDAAAEAETGEDEADAAEEDEASEEEAAEGLGSLF